MTDRVVLADDSLLLRVGLERLLAAEGFDVVGSVGDADQLLRRVAEVRPDAVIVDIRMPPTFTDEGLRAALRLRREEPGLAVLLLSQYIETRDVVRSWSRARPASATCSRTASPTSTGSWPTCGGSWPAARPWTRSSSSA
ncbi:response regulator [Dactylosporangium darangshiense]